MRGPTAGGSGTWDTALVTDMSMMFETCLLFNADISAWGTSAVEDMNMMFCATTCFNQDLLRSWF